MAPAAGMIRYNTDNKYFERSTDEGSSWAELDLSGMKAPADVGDIKLRGTVTNPTLWLDCDGASYLRSAKAALFAKIGTTFGAADGTHFNVPDIRGRAPIGDGTGSGLTARVLGTNYGEELHVLLSGELAAHTHGAGSYAADSAGAHTHSLNDDSAGGGSAGEKSTGCGGSGSPQTTGSGGAHTHTISGTSASTGSGTGHNNIQPSLGIHFCIYAGV